MGTYVYKRNSKSKTIQAELVSGEMIAIATFSFACGLSQVYRPGEGRSSKECYPLDLVGANIERNWKGTQVPTFFTLVDDDGPSTGIPIFRASEGAPPFVCDDMDEVVGYLEVVNRRKKIYKIHETMFSVAWGTNKGPLLILMGERKFFSEKQARRFGASKAANGHGVRVVRHDRLIDIAANA